MSDLSPGLHRASAICLTLAHECDHKVDAVPHSPANPRRRAESRALRRAAAAITRELLDQPLPAPTSLPSRCRRAGCLRPTTHPSGMCETHRPGFAQADEHEEAA